MLRSALTYALTDEATFGSRVLSEAFTGAGPDLVHVRGAIAPSVAAACVAELSGGFEPYRWSDPAGRQIPPVMRVGEALYERLHDLDAFLEGGASANLSLAAQYPLTNLVAETIIHRLKGRWEHGDVVIGQEPGRGTHRQWIVRSMPNGTGPHRDSTTEEAPGLCLAAPGVERAVNLYLENGVGGGDLVLYGVQPRTGEPTRHLSGTDRFLPAVYEQVAHLCVPVLPGDLAIFDPSLVHAVRPPVGERIALAFFLKRIGDDLHIRT